MAENLDEDDVPAEPATNGTGTNGHAPEKVYTKADIVPPEAWSQEQAMLAAVLGQDGPKFWDQLKEFEPACWTDPVAKALVTQLRAGVDREDLWTLARGDRHEVAKLLQLQEIDRYGAMFSMNLRIFRDRVRKEMKAKLSAQLAEHPDMVDQIAPQIVALSKESDGLLDRRTMDAFNIVPKTDWSCLLGNRYLNRGDGMVFAGNSGMGKSSMMLQAATLWALGEDFMGIKPNGPLKSLIIQSEDSDGDIAEVRLSIAHYYKFGPKELDTIKRNLHVVTDRIHRGADFLLEVKGHIRATRPDLVWINPLAAFIDGDISDAEQAGTFLRENLNSINHPPSFAWIAVHHTTKPSTGKDKGTRAWNEEQYNMAGSYDLIGWARAIWSLVATDVMGEFNLILAKRGSRADIKVAVKGDNGIEKWERTNVIPLKHATGFFTPPGGTEEIPLVVWEPRAASPSEVEAKKHAGGRPKKNSLADFSAIFEADPAKAKGQRQLHRLADEIRPISRGAFQTLLADGVTDGFLVCDRSNPVLPKYYLNTKPKIDDSDA